MCLRGEIINNQRPQYCLCNKQAEIGITPEIRQLMRTRDKWHKSAIKTKDSIG